MIPAEHKRLGEEMVDSAQSQDKGRFHHALGVRRVLNGSGTWTKFGSAVVGGALAQSIAEALSSAFDIEELQDSASKTIATVAGAEAGTVVNCTAAGICVAAAALVAGANRDRIRKLPLADWPEREILVQEGQAVDFGAELTQMLRSAGAIVVVVGEPDRCDLDELKAGLSERTAGAVFVVSHLCPQQGLVPLAAFAEVMHGAGVPVMVDAAAEFDIPGMHRDGADLVIQSAQKFPAGPTAGIVSGRADLIAAVRAQSAGLGRAMKASKEAIAGAMLALKRMASDDLATVRARQGRMVEEAQRRLAGIAGLSTGVHQDLTDIPVTRLRITIDPAAAGLSARDLNRRLIAHDPVVAVRDTHAARGDLLVDPRSLSEVEMWELCEIIRDQMRLGRKSK
jgi:L-seryl-tRNA(Ser) seleniumtransferase